MLEGVASPFARGSSLPRDQTQVSCVSCISRQILYHWATWEALFPRTLGDKLGDKMIPVDKWVIVLSNLKLKKKNLINISASASFWVAVPLALTMALTAWLTCENSRQTLQVTEPGEMVAERQYFHSFIYSESVLYWSLLKSFFGSLNQN